MSRFPLSARPSTPEIGRHTHTPTQSIKQWTREWCCGTESGGGAGGNWQMEVGSWQIDAACFLMIVSLSFVSIFLAWLWTLRALRLNLFHILIVMPLRKKSQRLQNSKKTFCMGKQWGQDKYDFQFALIAFTRFAFRLPPHSLTGWLADWLTIKHLWNNCCQSSIGVQTEWTSFQQQ